MVVFLDEIVLTGLGVHSEEKEPNLPKYIKLMLNHSMHDEPRCGEYSDTYTQVRQGYHAAKVSHTGERKCVKGPCGPRTQVVAICGTIHLSIVRCGH